MNATEKLQLLKSEKITAEQNIKNFISEIEKNNQKGNELNAVLSLNPDAIEQAREVDKKIKAGKAGKLAGLGIIIKANICVKGLECNCASLTLKDWIAPYDATVIDKIKKQKEKIEK